MRSFDVLSDPIDVEGRYFLEASAGTGKTFAIEHLVVRMLIESDIPLSQMLLVTFTTKAASELRERVLLRLETTLEALEKGLALPDYMKRSSPEELGPIKRKLEASRARFEEASIFTLHGFCSYVLQKEGVISPLFLENVDKSELFEELVKDLLREGNLFSARQLEILLNSAQNSVELLTGQVRSLVEKELPILHGASYKELLAHFQERASFWQNKLGMSPEKLLADLLSLAPCFKEMCNRARELKEERRWEIESFVEAFFSGSFLPDDRLDMRPEDLLASKNPSKLKLFYSEFLSILQEEFLPLLDRAYDPLRLQGALAEEAQRRMRASSEERVVFYDDLIQMMQQGCSRESFVKRVREHYRAVFIDEFQDVDARLFSIFSTLFLEAEQGSLFFIGDPKQSIYRFRKADLHTYLKARSTFAEDRILSLSTNFRSRAALVAGLNELFEPAAHLLSPPGEIALPYTPLKAGRKDEKNLFSDARGPIHFITGDSEEALFETILSEIGSLYEQGLALSQIAVLVRDRYQAMRFQKRCEAWKIPSTFIRAPSLVESDSFSLLYRMLYTALHPKKRGAARLLFLDPIFSHLPSQTKEMLFFGAVQTLLQRGVRPFLRELESKMGLAEPALRGPGFRFYLELIELAEKVDENAVGSPLHYLESLKNRNRDSSELEARASSRSALSTEDALSLVTLHASKGLEFDVVFPIGLFTRYKKRSSFTLCREKLELVLSKKLAEEDQVENRAEEMRLLYVAATRAKERLYLPILEKKEESPIGYFLEKRLSEPLESWIQSHSHFTLSAASMGARPAFKLRERAPIQLIRPQPLSLSIQSRSQLSFSSLKKTAEVERIKSESSDPSGAAFGIFCHCILEKIDLRLAFGAKNAEEIELLIAPYFAESDPTLLAMKEKLARWIFNAFHTPLNASEGHFALAEIDSAKTLREMEFLYPVEENFLKGYIDLVFEHRGRLYFIDWKSHDLGDECAYAQDKLKALVEAEGYSLQAKIYREAVKKYFLLFDCHYPIEGFFLFLRGIKSPNQGILNTNFIIESEI